MKIEYLWKDLRFDGSFCHTVNSRECFFRVVTHIGIDLMSSCSCYKREKMDSFSTLMCCNSMKRQFHPSGSIGKHVRRHYDWPYRWLRGTHEKGLWLPLKSWQQTRATSPYYLQSVDNFVWSQAAALVPADERHSRVSLPVLWMTFRYFSLRHGWIWPL